MTEVRASVVVRVDPQRAFDFFTRDVDRWWHRGERYGGVSVVGHVFEPRVGGRFFQVLADREAELGRILVWAPPHRLAFSWRQRNWLPNEVTEVEVTFTACRDGTEVILRHSGFEAIQSDIGCDVGYAAGWNELLSWLLAAVESSDKIVETSA